jgi:hypothetical protein
MHKKQNKAKTNKKTETLMECRVSLRRPKCKWWQEFCFGGKARM